MRRVQRRYFSPGTTRPFIRQHGQSSVSWEMLNFAMMFGYRDA